jgi:hypothetical protein
MTFAEDSSTDSVRKHGDQTFHQVGLREPGKGSSPILNGAQANHPAAEGPDMIVGHGQGDLTKGRLVCQRVSELAARTDLAKQIRVLVKEHATDRVRERTGREPEQDIEVLREEIVQEYLQGVTITDRRIDEETKTCSATAVMQKSRLQPPASTIEAGSPEAARTSPH